jgi:hypothetical protein
MERSSTQMCTTSVIFRPLPKVNNRPWGENSPNLVTLAPGKTRSQCFFSITETNEQTIGEENAGWVC